MRMISKHVAAGLFAGVVMLCLSVDADAGGYSHGGRGAGGGLMPHGGHITPGYQGGGAGYRYGGGSRYAGGAAGYRLRGGRYGGGYAPGVRVGAGYGPSYGGGEPQVYSAPTYNYAPQPYLVPTTVYQPVTRSYTVPVVGYRTVDQTHYVPVTTYQPVVRQVQVPVVGYQTYQRVEQVPTTVYRQVVPSCGCSYGQ